MVSFPVLSQIKPQAPLLVVPFRNPKTLISHRSRRSPKLIPGRHCLWLRLGRQAYDYWQDQPGSIPSRRPSHMVLNALPRQGRGRNEAIASFVSRDKIQKLRANKA
ncbi:hypothetical protein V6N13_040327 [Hibiscus sabdariffa]